MTDNAHSVLLKLLKSSLFGIKADLPDDTDYDAAFNEAKAQTVVALASAAVPPEKSVIWQESAAQSTAHYMRALFEQTNLIKLFESNNIPLVILKGTAAAMYYPKPQLRTMGDIDFLVFDTDYERAYSLLQNNGYKFECDYDDGRDYTFTKGEVVFELHKKYSDTDFDIEEILINGMKNRILRTVNGIQFPSLPDYENGLVLLDHIRHHLKGGLGLRQIIDWTMFANQVLSNENYQNHFLPLLKSAGLETFCKVVTKMCKTHLFLPESITWCDTADAVTADEFFEAVIKSGNFGRKNPYVYKPMASFTSEVKKHGFFKALQNAGIENFEICKKNKFFRTFAWLFQLFRYIKRGVISLFKGEKLLDDISSGNEEADFNKRLGI